MNRKLQTYRCVINPGHVVFSDAPTLIFTVCGSGVAITIWDRIRRFGGMAHCVLPKCCLGQKPSNYHVDVALPLLVKQFMRYTRYAGNLEAQIFGGGNLRGAALKNSIKTISAARKILKKSRINIMSEDTGGALGRKVIFNTSSGDAVVYKTRNIRLADWSGEYMLKQQV